MSAAGDKQQREELLGSVPETEVSPVRTRRGFRGEDEAPAEVTVQHTEGGETRLDLDFGAGYMSEEARASITAYLDPLAAVTIGERLIASGRKALDELVDGLRDPS